MGFTLGKTHPRDSRPYHFAAQHLRVLHGHLEEAGELDDIYVVDCPYGNGNAENPTSTATDAVKNINLAQAAFAEAAQLTNVNLADSRNGKVSLRCDTSSFGPSFVLTQVKICQRIIVFYVLLN